MTRIYLVRHCEAQGNLDRIFQGSFDADVTPNGLRQLDALSRRFEDIPLDAVWSSPLIRARKTAEAVNRSHDLPIHFDKDLQEIHGGVWEGMKWADLPQQSPEMCDRWQHQPWLFEAKGGESMQQVYDRMKKALLHIVAFHSGQTVAVASHGCAIRNALCWIKFNDITRLNDVNWCDNTAISVIDFDENLKPKLVVENDAKHLTLEMSSFQKQSWWKKGAEWA